MGTAAIKSHGTIIARQDLGVGGFTDIGELLDIEEPAVTHNAIETTSQADTVEHFLAGMLRSSEFSFGVNFDPDGATHDHTTGLRKSADDGQIDGWRFTRTDASSLIVSGFITSLVISEPSGDDKVTAQITVRPTAASISA